jgi:hypothetical protein
MIEYENQNHGRVYMPEPRLLIKPGTFKGSQQELRELVLKQIEDYPETFEMGSWVENIEGHDLTEYDQVTPEWLEKAGEGTAGCGTTMCIAGYVQLFVEGRITDQAEIVAKDALGLDDTTLFYMDNYYARERLQDLVNNPKNS